MPFNIAGALIGAGANAFLGAMFGGGGPREDPLRRVLRLRLRKLLKQHGPETIQALLLWAQQQDALGAGPDVKTAQRAAQRVRRVGTTGVEQLGHLYSIQGFGEGGAPETSRHTAATVQDINVAAEMAGLQRPADTVGTLMGALDPRRAASLPSTQNIRNQRALDDQQLYGAIGQLLSQHTSDIMDWIRGSGNKQPDVFPWIPPQDAYV
jgi:hypothetical protein